MTDLTAEPASIRASDFIERANANRDELLMMFALERCEFSSSVRRFQKEIGIPFQSVDLYSVAIQIDSLRRDIRKALHVRTG